MGSFRFPPFSREGSLRSLRSLRFTSRLTDHKEVWTVIALDGGYSDKTESVSFIALDPPFIRIILRNTDIQIERGILIFGTTCSDEGFHKTFTESLPTCIGMDRYRMDMELSTRYVGGICVGVCLFIGEGDTIVDLIRLIQC